MFKNFEGAELPGGSPLILPLEIPVDTQFGADRTIGNNLPSDTSPVNVDESWDFGWELPCATRYIRVTAEYDANVPDALVTGPLLDLDVTITNSQGDSIADGGIGTLDADNQKFVWFLDGRYDALDQDTRDIKAGVRQSMISNYRDTVYTVNVDGTALPGELRFTAELDYHDSEDSLNAEQKLAAYDLTQGNGDCDPAKRVFNANP